MVERGVREEEEERARDGNFGGVNKQQNACHLPGVGLGERKATNKVIRGLGVRMR